jgi:hypothetical protein
MFKALVLLIVCFSLLACNPGSEKQVSENTSVPEHIALLEWARVADAQHDAKTAIANSDYRLLILAGRGERMLGISPEESGSLKKRCGTRYLQGSTDVIRDDEHLSLLNKAHQYAEEYNKIVATACQGS